ncbi:MAG: hypothetical protein WDZ76_09540 [Pseudohongiellaceae bacterium]
MVKFISSIGLASLIIVSVNACSGLSALAQLPEQPELPRSLVDTMPAEPSGRVIDVPAGDDFQAALNNAMPGDVIELEAGAVYEGPFTLPTKAGDEWIIIRSNATDDGLPGPGNRIDPGFADLMPKLVSFSGSVVRTEAGAHHYRFEGVEMRPGRRGETNAGSIRRLRNLFAADGEGEFLYNIVELGSERQSAEEVPHHIIFDRCYIHGDPEKGSRRGIAINSAYTAIIDSWLSDFKEVGADSQAIAGWNGPGPFKIVNNYLEGAGENIIFGGADTSIAELVPSDIEIRDNHFFKPLEWKTGHPDYAGTEWSVKNLFELKNARRVLVDGNVFEHNWAHAQNGFSILFTVRNERGRVPWAVVEDVTFSNNLLLSIGSGINILGQDDNRYPSEPTRRLLIKNNVFADMGGPWGDGVLFQLLDGVENLTIDNNTAFNTGRIISADGRPHRPFALTDNIILHNTYGIVGSSTGRGNGTLFQYFPAATVRGNVMVGAPAESYPEENHYPDGIDEVAFVAPEQGNYRLRADSPFRSESGNGFGANVDALCSALSGIERTVFCQPERLSQRLADSAGSL